MSDDAESGKWLKVKSRMPNNEKVIALSDAAFRLHIGVSCWCCEEVNDGEFKTHVPAGMPKAPQGKDLTKAIREIVKAGLWKPTTEGYAINDFLKYNMSRAQWEAMKAGGKEGGKRSGEARRRENEPPAEGGGSGGRTRYPSRGPKAHPEHDHDHEERSKKAAAAKDLEASARVAAESRAAAAAGILMLDPGERARLLRQSPSLVQQWQPWRWPEVLAFGEALQASWQRPVLFGEAEDPLVGLLVAALAGGAAERLTAAGHHVGQWLAEGSPDGRARSLNMVTLQVLRRGLEDAEAAASLESGVDDLLVAAERRLAAGGQA